MLSGHVATAVEGIITNASHFKIYYIRYPLRIASSIVLCEDSIGV